MIMRVLIVASYNKKRFAPFIQEQAAALQREGCEIDWFGVTGKGIAGYISAFPALMRKIAEYKPDVIHAHYGLSGLLANLQRRTPVVTTYHGSDINNKIPRAFSKLSMMLSQWNIFVSAATMKIAHPHRCFSLLPCGVDLNDLQLTDKQQAREQMRLSPDAKYILFAGAFDNQVKNAPLAKVAVAELTHNDAYALSENTNVHLIELKGYNRDEVTLLMCAADALLLTSKTEGSPQVVKEAMACGCPIVSVDVGDVKERTEGIKGCFVAHSRQPQDLALLLGQALAFNGKTDGRSRIISEGLDNKHVAHCVREIYNKIVK